MSCLIVKYLRTVQPLKAFNWVETPGPFITPQRFVHPAWCFYRIVWVGGQPPPPAIKKS